MLTKAQAIAHIEAEMKRRELTAADVARALGTDRSFISLVRAGKRPLPERLLTFFGLREVIGYEPLERSAGSDVRRQRRAPAKRS